MRNLAAPAFLAIPSPSGSVRVFWTLVANCLRPSGRTFPIEDRRDPTRTTPDPYLLHEADDVQTPRLGDGSEHRVIKVFYELDELGDRLRPLGWHPQLTGCACSAGAAEQVCGWQKRDGTGTVEHRRLSCPPGRTAANDRTLDRRTLVVSP